MGRRNFDPEYKLRVARMVVDEGQGVPQVVRDTGVGETAVRRWVEQLKADRSGEAGDGRPLTPEQRRIRELEEENRRLREDKALLKKASVSSTGRRNSGHEFIRRGDKAQGFPRSPIQAEGDFIQVGL
ncbi:MULTISPECIES: transposase [unclassified Thioalkalivibrio]|uniref:transposase n=1 Tax=unclassified Thioalkalivibrio TaxID=2621013 RepID=UPI0009DA046F